MPAQITSDGFPAALLVRQLNELLLRRMEKPVESQNLQCADHQKACDMFCQQCCKLICTKCCSQDHKDHSKLNAEDIVDEHRENVHSSHNEFSNKLEEFEKSLSALHKAKVECKAKAETAKQAARKQGDDIMKIVESAVMETHQIINIEASKEISEIEEREEEMLLEYSEMSDILRGTGAWMKSENAASIMNTSINKIPEYRRVLENITVEGTIPKVTIELELSDVKQFTLEMLLGKLEITKREVCTQL